MMNDGCKCGHTKMYHSVMGRCMAREDGHVCPCIEFTALDSVKGYPVLSDKKGLTVEYRES